MILYGGTESALKSLKKVPTEIFAKHENQLNDPTHVQFGLLSLWLPVGTLGAVPPCSVAYDDVKVNCTKCFVYFREILIKIVHILPQATSRTHSRYKPSF